MTITIQPYHTTQVFAHSVDVYEKGIRIASFSHVFGGPAYSAADLRAKAGAQ